jgi:hypothetical protein
VRPPELEKTGARETGAVARPGARVRQGYRKVPVLPSKSDRRGDPPLGEDSRGASRGLRHTQPAEAAREGLSTAKNESRHHNTRSIRSLRVQCRYSALARFRLAKFADQPDTQSRGTLP